MGQKGCRNYEELQLCLVYWHSHALARVVTGVDDVVTAVGEFDARILIGCSAAFGVLQVLKLKTYLSVCLELAQPQLHEVNSWHDLCFLRLGRHVDLHNGPFAL
jgi:hypothetical protein